MSLLILILSVVFFFETGTCIPEDLVVNGNNTDVTKYPFMVTLTHSKYGYFLSGATIIAPSWVMTAGHCVFHLTANEISIYYGANILHDNGRNVAAVRQIIVHERFNFSNPETADIALLELKDPLIYNYTEFAPVTLPEQYFEIPQNESYVPGILIGWTQNSTEVVNGRLLHEVELKIYSNKECRPEFSQGNKLCAGNGVDDTGPCFGDSAAALLYKGSIQLGIMSMTLGICGTSGAGVYTEVSHFIPWINQNIYR